MDVLHAKANLIYSFGWKFADLSFQNARQNSQFWLKKSEVVMGDKI